MLSKHATELPSQPLCYDCLLHFGTGSHKLVLEPTCGPGKPLTPDPSASVSTQLGWRAYATRPSLPLVFRKCLCLYSVSACYWFPRERASSSLFLQSWGSLLNVCLWPLAWPSSLVWETLTFHLALTLIADVSASLRVTLEGGISGSLPGSSWLLGCVPDCPSHPFVTFVLCYPLTFPRFAVSSSFWLLLLGSSLCHLSHNPILLVCSLLLAVSSAALLPGSLVGSS